MKETKIDKKEYSLIVYLIIFFSIIILVSTVRLVLIFVNDNSEITKDEYLYITNQENLSEAETESSNIHFVNNLESQYGVEIYYGESASRFAESVNAVGIKDNKQLSTMLVNLSNALEKYPINIIKEMKEDGYDVAIYLVDYFKNANVAIANRNSNNEFKIYLSSNTSFERAMHHETYHILEYYMNLEYATDNLFVSWDKLNPDGFVYTEDVNNITSDYVYGKDFIRKSYFVTLYSKYSAKEDRAEIFAESMMAETRPIYYTSRHIKDKMELINTNIKKSFLSTNIGLTNYWEKYL